MTSSEFKFTAEGSEWAGTMWCDSDWGPEKKFPGILLLQGSAPDDRLEKLTKRLGDLKFAAMLLPPLPPGPKGQKVLKRALFAAQMREEVRTDQICIWGTKEGADLALVAASTSNLWSAAVAMDPLATAECVPAVPTVIFTEPGRAFRLGGELGQTVQVEDSGPGGPGWERVVSDGLSHVRKHTYEKPVEEKPFISAVTDYMGM